MISSKRLRDLMKQLFVSFKDEPKKVISFGRHAITPFTVHFQQKVRDQWLKNIIIDNWNLKLQSCKQDPSIAQLVERRTVVANAVILRSLVRIRFEGQILHLLTLSSKG